MLKKGKSGWGFFFPLLAHVMAHAVSTFAIGMFWKLGFSKACALAAFDGVVHFFMDRIKAGPKYLGRWGLVDGSVIKACNSILANPLVGPIQTKTAKDWLRRNSYFWWALGADQAVHHATGIVIVFFMCS